MNTQPIQSVNEQPKPKGLIAKLCEVMAEAGYIQKRGHNERFNYDYATEADVVNSLRDKLASRNVFVFPSVVSEDRKELSKTNSGATMLITDIVVKWTFVDGDTGESQECLMPGCGSDTGDKGIYKAITGSSKYLFLKAFMLPTGDDPEDEKPDREEGRKAAQAVAQRKIAEAKAKNATGSSQTHANGGMAPNPIDKHESVTLTPRDGLLAISGPGLNIIRSEMTDDDRKFFGIKFLNGFFCFEEKLVFKFQDLCTRLKVPYIMADQGLPKANIPPADTFHDPPKSDDPILEEAKELKPKGKTPFMLIKWNGGEHSSFDKGMWPMLIAAVGKPTILEVKANGKYSNVVRILRVDGVNFADEQNQQSEPQDDWIPF